MKLKIISGLSGSGKSIALHALEDLGYYCIDNLPITMLPLLADELRNQLDDEQSDFAVGVDARSLNIELDNFPEVLIGLREQAINCEVLFLEASDPTLLKRFSETRRKHPLSNNHVPLFDAIKQERELLEPISSNADLLIDTSHTNVHQLRDIVCSRVTQYDQTGLSILFQSFGFKHGIPVDVDFMFDIRCLPNPHWQPELRALTGKDQAVIDFLQQYNEVNEMQQDISQLIEKWLPHFEADNRSYMTIAIGCTGGQHRSVYIVDRLTEYFSKNRDRVLSRHREIV